MNAEEHFLVIPPKQQPTCPCTAIYYNKFTKKSRCFFKNYIDSTKIILYYITKDET